LTVYRLSARTTTSDNHNGNRGHKRLAQAAELDVYKLGCYKLGYGMYDRREN
jgi:hypothetical protein